MLYKVFNATLVHRGRHWHECGTGAHWSSNRWRCLVFFILCMLCALTYLSDCLSTNSILYYYGLNGVVIWCEMHPG